MLKNEKFLTESSLKDILVQIYPNSDIFCQNKHFDKKWDYEIVLNKKDYDRISKDVDKSHFNKKRITLLVEFDGNYHYQLNNQVAKDNLDPTNYSNWFCYQTDQDEDFFLLRIPYWVQLDSTMTNHWFNLNRDFSNGFPHGFISSKCVLPGTFCSMGEKRFIGELAALPPKVAESVVDSLIVKSGLYNKFSINKMASVGSLDLWERLIQFHPMRELLQGMRGMCECPDNYHRYLSPFFYETLEANPIIRNLYLNQYTEKHSEHSSAENRLAYCDYHGISLEEYMRLSKMELLLGTNLNICINQ